MPKQSDMLRLEQVLRYLNHLPPLERDMVLHLLRALLVAAAKDAEDAERAAPGDGDGQG